MKLKIVLPKGRIFKGVCSVLDGAGLGIEVDERSYVPRISDSEIEAKIMKPQNIPQLVELGSHDAGFTGLDWINETGADVEEIMDLGLDRVKIVAAVPSALAGTDFAARERLVVASEYENITRRYLESLGCGYVFVRTHGATEVFPPDDADMIVDNTATGRTLKENGLAIVTTVMESSTRFIANKRAMQDQWKRRKIENLAILIRSVMDARARVMLEMNVPKDKFDEIVRTLPCMRSPTVAPLYQDEGFAVKVAVKRGEASALILRLKELGAMDILEYEIRKVVL
ncbi:MAG: ATP phosphoribosyltransferase [Candidatus Wallbacteria bacterium]|nr:ATP phosphoribosyltransferase [Candidatus Wallbacteria bacterium]